MTRKILGLAALWYMLGNSDSAKADLDFSFSVTNTIGNVPGTFTGEIFGLYSGSPSGCAQTGVPEPAENVLSRDLA